MSKKFEAHITFDHFNNPQLRDAIEALVLEHGFKFSQIYGDPVLGAKTYAYGTAYAESSSELIHRMSYISQCAEDYLNLKLTVVRMKVEEIVFDFRNKEPEKRSDG